MILFRRGLELSNHPRHLLQVAADLFVELLAVELRQVLFELGDLSLVVGTTEGTGTPRRTPVDFFERRKVLAGVLVTQGHVDDPVVSQRRQGVDDGDFLPTTGSTGGDKHPGKLAEQLALSPVAPGLIPERLPLTREVPESGGDPEQERIVFQKHFLSSHRVVSLGRSVHQAQHVVQQRFRHLVDVNGTTSSPNTLGDRLGQLVEMTVHRVVENTHFRSHGQNMSIGNNNRIYCFKPIAGGGCHQLYSLLISPFLLIH